MKPILYLIVPCYNEEQVLPISSKMFLEKIESLIDREMISEDSRILFVNDGSKDNSWEMICELSKINKHFLGISQSRNRGHQNAVWAGLMEAKDRCDITISIDCDGQDDINAIDEMVKAYSEGNEIVFGVRNSRKTDTFFKRFFAESYYKVLKLLGADVIYNHADYRLISSKVIAELEKYKEVNLYLRGLILQVGFKSTEVYYERARRMAGDSKYPVGKMIGLALDGITSLSVAPLKLITRVGLLIAFTSFVGAVWSVLVQVSGHSVAGWASMTCIICFLGGIQLIALGVLGEYIGKIYMETKERPRYIISERTGFDDKSENQE